MERESTKKSQSDPDPERRRSKSLNPAGEAEGAGNAAAGRTATTTGSGGADGDGDGGHKSAALAELSGEEKKMRTNKEHGSREVDVQEFFSRLEVGYTGFFATSTKISKSAESVHDRKFASSWSAGVLRLIGKRLG